MANRPVSRKRNITGGSSGVHRRGSGIGSGPVGGGRVPIGGSSGGGYRGNGGSGGSLLKIIIIAAVFLLGGGGGLSALFGGGTDSSTSTSSNTMQTVSTLANLFMSGYGSSAQSGNSSWSSKSNTGLLDETVDSSAREKYTTILGDGEDVYTIMVYMCGTDLESNSAMATKDIQEMLAADISDNINLLVYTGGCSSWRNNVVSSSTNQIYQIKDGKMNLVKDNIGDLVMTDPDTLSGFIQYGAKNYEADRYALIFWDHGGGSVTGYGYDQKHASAGAMDLAEINQALADGGVKYDFVGFDACLMATVETALMLDAHSDYLIASEETEPGIGWYYTDWLTELSENTSMSTIEIGQHIVDDFVNKCATQCAGQKTTLSVVDLAELSATVPEDLTAFASYTTELIETKEYSTVSTARASTREFASSSQIDQIDLIDFAIKLGSDEGEALAEALKGAVKYNNTSSNMTNAYGLSIYFPYRKTSKVDTMVDTYDEIGMDESYSECIQKFASMAYYGQAAGSSSGYTTPTSLLFNTGSTSTSHDSSELVYQLLSSFVKSSAESTSFLDRGVDMETASEYIAENSIDSTKLVWQMNASGDNIIVLEEDVWNNVQELELSCFVDDGEGYIDLGLDNVFEFDDDGYLMAPSENTWIGIDGQIVSYYHIDTTGDADDYTITGRVPCYLNGERADLILIFDSENENGYVAGATFDYTDGETETVAKNLTELEAGDTIDFVCDYYSYDGTYNDSYYLGEQLTVSDSMAEMEISDLYIEDGEALLSYVFTDIYGNTYYSDGLTQ